MQIIISNILKMNTLKKAKVIKIVSGTIYHLLDTQAKTINVVELQPTPTKSNYYPLLKTLSEVEVEYETLKKGNKIKQETPKAVIYLNGKQISNLYGNDQKILECTEQKIYERDQIIQCYIMDVKCLEMKLYLMSENKYLIFYFSQLKLPKVQHSHPKQVWVKAEQYYKSQFLGSFAQIKINGSQSYKEEVNIYGQVLRLHDGLDLKQKCLEDGYAELQEKKCSKYLTQYQVKKLNQIVQQSKKEKKGIWREQKAAKGSNQVLQQKYVQWQSWTKKKLRYNQIKNVEQQFKQINTQLKKNMTSKADPVKGRILVECVLSIFEDNVNQKNFGLLEQFSKNVITALVNLQTSTLSSLNSNIENTDFLRYLNKLICSVYFFVLQSEKQGNKNKQISAQFEKIIKIVFKYCFIGNETFHKKVFDKRKQSDFQKFQFDPAYLSGISSYSQASDLEQADKNNKHNKAQKKLMSIQGKIRTNATLLLSNIFKNYPNIVENHWQICVNSNVLTKDFLQYLQKLKLSIEPNKMTPQQKQKVVSFMRTNFGDYSLVLLVFFQQNPKVKMNALNCMIHMIGNFQSRKIIDTTQAGYVQKLLNQTKSSFVPKSFIVFSGLRNALYFMLFSLHHQRNVLIINNTFKALTQLCQQSTLVDKMGFMEGMGLLMSNYISPVLKFPWQVRQLAQLKCLCIDFLGALVNTQKKWDQMQSDYLMSEGEKNINASLLKIVKNYNNQNKDQFQKIISCITKYFKNIARKYYSAIFFQVSPGLSIWSTITNYYLKNPNQLFPIFVQEVFKCHFDQVSLIKSQNSIPRKIIQSTNKAQSLFGTFLSEFFPIYSQIVIVDNYIGLINLITYVPYHKWSDNSYQTAKQFLVHCFESVKGPSSYKNFPSIQHLKTNSLLRLSLIKLLGYISFCKQFQIPEFSTPSIRNLLQYSRTYKSPNSVVKLTWGISNWSNIDCFKEGLTEDQLKQCLNYMIKLSQSDKEKIASNCTRGIGFFLTKLNTDVDLQQCRNAIIRNLLHPIIKVRTNSTKTLRMMVTNKLMWKVEQGAPRTQQLISTLEHNILKNNYHLQTQTLLLIKQLGNPIKQSQMLKIYSHILHDLLSHTTLEYQFSQIKALKQLRKVVLEETIKYAKFLMQKQTIKDFYQTIQNFLLDSQQQSLRKEAQHSKILQRGFQKGEQALKAVFNIKKQKYDQQKMIKTEFTMRGLQYQANEQDLELLEHIKKVSGQLQQKDDEKQKWKFLAQMKIQGKKVIVGRVQS